MNVLDVFQRRFRAALADLTNEPDELCQLVRPSQDPQFGDYQANMAMLLAKRLSRSPRDVAAEIVARLDVADLCQPPDIAGPGFINLRLRDDWLAERLGRMTQDERLMVPSVEQPRTFVVDYSAPNVAKPMHVGHIRSTVIGECLYRTLKFLGHRVIGDNHLGDWGTQFGMILYGYKHFRDEAAMTVSPVEELSRLYRLVSKLVGYHEGRTRLADLLTQLARHEQALERHVQAAAAGDPKAAKKADKDRRQLERALHESRSELSELRQRLDEIENDPVSAALVAQHPHIAAEVLRETAKLHAGDPENRRLWEQFLPACQADIDRIYRRLGVTFDHTLGESFYHDQLSSVVADLTAKRLVRESDEAKCVFLDGYDTPMIVQKQDGAFLYATTDLATIAYRMKSWQPDAILYVVDHRQSLHFEQLFAVARLWGYTNVELQHVKFGTVLGNDGRPFKTRTGDTVGLWGLLDEAVARALAIVTANDDAKPDGPELSAEARQQVAEAVGIGALKYADVSQNRESDYVFSYDKMLAMNGNTATYMQYAHARVRSIFAKGQQKIGGFNSQTADVHLGQPAERDLALALVRFSEALMMVAADYRPNHLTNYLFDLANRYSTFYEKCPVLKAETQKLQRSRLLLCDLTARTLKQGLSLLGINVVEKMQPFVRGLNLNISPSAARGGNPVTE